MTYLRAPGRSPERILVFGIEGTGKTRGFLSIVRATANHPGITHYIIDNDNGVDRLLETEFDDLGVREEFYVRDGKLEPDDQFTREDGTIVLIHASGWDNNAAAMNFVVENAQRGDWWCIDNATNLWSDIQAWYVEKVHGLDIDDFLLEYRVAAKKEAAKGGEEKAPGATEAMFVEWNFVNPVYQKHVQRHLMQPPCHLYITALQGDLNPRDKDKTTADLYGSVSVKPRGQKSLGANAQTVLWIKKMQRGEWKYKTLKDRGREEWQSYAVDDFATDYLEGVAGWAQAPTSTPTSGDHGPGTQATGPSTSSGVKKKIAASSTAKVQKKNSG